MTFAELEDIKRVADILQDICSGHNCTDCQLVNKNHDCIKVLVNNIIKRSERTVDND